MVDRIRQIEPLLSRAEKSVAQAILADIDRATRSSTKELAKRAGVSEPTIVRFARHVGSVTSHAVCCDAVGLNYPDHAFCMMPIAMRA